MEASSPGVSDVSIPAVQLSGFEDLNRGQLMRLCSPRLELVQVHRLEHFDRLLLLVEPVSCTDDLSHYLFFYYEARMVGSLL